MIEPMPAAMVSTSASNANAADSRAGALRNPSLAGSSAACSLVVPSGNVRCRGITAICSGNDSAR